VSAVVSLDAARRLKSVKAAEDVESATWELADALVADVPPEGGVRPSPSGVKDGSHQAIALVAEEMRREGLDYSAGVLSHMRNTALAWAEDTRVHKGAPFSVHLELRGREDRVAILRRLMGQHGGRVTVKQVRTWKQDQNRTQPQTWTERMQGRIASIAREAKTDEAKEALADLFTDAARELRNG
jgi:hypothetical protein